jgi:hypothetical protein
MIQSKKALQELRELLGCSVMLLAILPGFLWVSEEREGWALFWRCALWALICSWAIRETVRRYCGRNDDQ